MPAEGTIAPSNACSINSLAVLSANSQTTSSASSLGLDSDSSEPVAIDTGQHWVLGRSQKHSSSSTGGQSDDTTGRSNPDLEGQGYEEVTVADQDTLWDLAAEHNVDFNELVELNSDHIEDPDLIYAGDKVYLPESTEGGSYDTAARGNPDLERQGYEAITVSEHDTLWDLAAEHNVDLDQLIELNSDHIQDPDLIFAGDKVYLPASADESESAQSRAPADVVADTLLEPENTGAEANEIEPLSSAESTDSSLSLSESGEAVATPLEEPGDRSLSDQQRTETGATSSRADLDDILTTYQVAEESNLGPDGEPLTWEPNLWGMTAPDWAIDGLGDTAGWIGDQTGWEGARQVERLADRASRDGSLPVLPSERKLLNELGPADQVRWTQTTDYASTRSTELVSQPEGNTMTFSEFTNDGHTDAVRHALWNATMTKEFGAEWTTAYATAHEQGRNPAAREAMDLYNNEVGRQIALDNPDASQAELEDLVLEALDNGELLVIDRNGALAWSNDVEIGKHGWADKSVTLPANENFTDATDRRAG